MQTVIEPQEVEPPVEQIFHEPTEEERRLASSDLEDCPEIWQPVVGTLIMDTRKRQRQIEQYFNRWIIVSESHPLSHIYAHV